MPPSSPWENPFVESFNGRLRDEFLTIEHVSSLSEVRVLAEQHRIEFNAYRPHADLQGRTSPWTSSSNGRRPDHPVSSHTDWSSKGSHVRGRASGGRIRWTPR
ncbi:transposase [Cyanobium sp. Morenito 9A2]|uniref:transposase n=1 Tax=Cyanobium sp. Morenito 9A2 TaxID=2823718 RepID=UPI0029EE9E7A|nr:transposase [Cyanobium sp. Morenito 9A2]